MHRPPHAARPLARLALGLALAGTALAGRAPADDDGTTAPDPVAASVPAAPVAPAAAPAPVPAAAAAPAGNPTLDLIQRRVEAFGRQALAWYRQTPPIDRVTWGGLGGCAALGVLALLERLMQLRRGRVAPADFLRRFRERLQDGKLDRNKALDLCELNPSPAARVALAAVKRWGRPVNDLERAVALAARVETDRLKRNVGTFRRIAAMAPLVGLLGTLIAAGRALSVGGANWGSALGAALIPLTAGVALSILALVIYDGLVGRVEQLAGMIDRLGAETVDAIAMSAPPPADPVPAPHRAAVEPRRGPHIPIRPQSHRIEIPDHLNPRLDDPFDD